MAGAIVVASGTLACGCAVDATNREYLDGFFVGDNDQMCKQVAAQGGVQAAASIAAVQVQSDRPDLNISLSEIASYIDTRCS
jgi:hypothetical protein